MSRLEELIKKHPVRKSEQSKAAFRAEIIEDMRSAGYDAKEELCGGKHKNIVIGDPSSAELVLTAHYDTPAASLFPNIMIPKSRWLFYLYQFVPIIFLLAVSLLAGYIVGGLIFNIYEVFLVSFLVVYYTVFFLMFRTFENKNNYNDNTSGIAAVLSAADLLAGFEEKKVAFILFDNEEKGKKGSKAYFADHKNEMENKLVLNLDCVGNGDHIVFIAKPEAMGLPLYEKLKASFEGNGEFTVHNFSSKEADANSDHKSFPCGVGCMACNKSKRGIFFAGRIHTSRDVVANDKNIEFIANGILNFAKNI